MKEKRSYIEGHQTPNSQEAVTCSSRPEDSLGLSFTNQTSECFRARKRAFTLAWGLLLTFPQLSWKHVVDFLI